jgi:hypothetical protein
MQNIGFAEIGIIDHRPREDRCLRVEFDELTMVELSEVEV